MKIHLSRGSIEESEQKRSGSGGPIKIQFQPLPNGKKMAAPFLLKTRAAIPSRRSPEDRGFWATASDLLKLKIRIFTELVFLDFVGLGRTALVQGRATDSRTARFATSGYSMN